jgi:hypothetical protein
MCVAACFLDKESIQSLRAQPRAMAKFSQDFSEDCDQKRRSTTMHGASDCLVDDGDFPFRLAKTAAVT